MTGDRKQVLARALRRFPASQFVLRTLVQAVSARFTAGVVGVVLDAQARILLVEHVFHPLSPWGLPGGWLEPGERPADAVRREIVEETGLKVDVGRPLLIDVSARRPHHVDMAFLCEARGEVVALNGELLAYDWFPLDAVPPLPDFHRAAVDRLRADHKLPEAIE